MATRGRQPAHDSPQGSEEHLCASCGEPIMQRRRGTRQCRVCAARASQAFLRSAVLERRRRDAA